MGIEIEVDSLEDMCALMCDNIIPRKGTKMKQEVDSIDFGKWMKAKRKARHITQDRLSEIILTNKNTISRYESGDRLPPLDVAERIAKYFGAELVIREKGNEGAD